MINYFAEAEKTLRARGKFEQALENLKRRQERAIKQQSPSEYPSLDLSKPYTSTGALNDALSVCVELAEINHEIEATEKAISVVDSVLDQLSADDAKILRLWYVQAMSKEQIAEAMAYASVPHLYDKRNAAVARFALLYFGAASLASATRI